jgi:transcriptional regulator with XRE-family HTH domain
MANEFFSVRVRQLRQQKGITMDDLAKTLGVTKSRISMWENNGTVPRSEVLIKLANYFGVTTDYLMGNDSSIAQDPTSARLNSLQRNLGKLSEEDLKKAEGVLKAVFMDIFNDEEEDDNDI